MHYMHDTNISKAIIGDRYQIIDLLGKGGVGITYSAIDLQTQEQVAIKEVSLKQLDDWKQIELLEREATVLAQLNHPAIPKYIDYFQLVESGWRTSKAEVKEIAQQILDIFIYLHFLESHVIHRDIKPHNFIEFTFSFCDHRLFL
jgi:eukaryotic-like serine/threonine-protein kinase